MKLRSGRGAAKGLPPLLFFTDPVRTPHPERIVHGLPRGAAVVFRTFGASDAVVQGRRIARAARRRRIVLFVGADEMLARRLGADGVHLPERQAACAGLVSRLRRRFVVTAAAHSLPAALRARRAGVEAIVVSPVFPSRSPSAGRPLGPRGFAVIARRAGVAAYALGGVNSCTALGLAGSGAVGLAAIEALT